MRLSNCGPLVAKSDVAAFERRIGAVLPAEGGRFLMTADPVDEYLGLLRRALQDWQPLLRAELLRILGFRFHPEVDLLHFEFFDDSTCERFFPFFLYAQRKQHGPQDYWLPFPTQRRFFQVPEDAGYFPGWMNLLSEHRRPLMDPETWRRYADATDNEGTNALTAAESQLIHDWFASTWVEVGGPVFPLSVYLLRVNAPQCGDGFDLQRLVPVTWTEVWK